MNKSARPRILLIDDEPALLAGLRRNLRNHFDVVIAPGGQEGLAALRADPSIAAVVSDMVMPHMDGAAFLSIARKENPERAFIVLTGQPPTNGDAVREATRGVRVLYKPCSSEHIAAAIHAALAERGARTP